MKTIRELIKEKSTLLREIDKLGPQNVAEELVELTSLLSSLNAETVEKHFTFNQKKVELLEEAKSVSKARMMAEATIEWKEWYERVKQGEALLSMIQAVKYYLKNANDEYRQTM